MVRIAVAIMICALAFSIGLAAQEGPDQQPDSKVALPKKGNPPPRSDQEEPKTHEGEYSSSKTYQIDFGAPPAAGATQGSTNGDDVNELRPWNPHMALKAVEVGDYYRKRKNYRAAESRYREALEWKPNDAIASYRLAQTLEKMKRSDEAVTYYRAYLKVLPHGEFAEDCHKSIARLSKTAENSKS